MSNTKIKKTLSKVYNRDKNLYSQNNISLRRINSKASLNSLNSETSRIKKDNKRMIKRL
jgi:hypothetical protein